MLISKNNEILLSDFGIITVSSSVNPDQFQEKTGTCIYMAPEQFQNKAVRASDQYALGITVYEWLCGSPPFEGNCAVLQYQHIHVAPQFLRERVPDISPAVEQVVLLALAKKFEERYPSVKAFAEALEQAATNPPPAPPVVDKINAQEEIKRIFQLTMSLRTHEDAKDALQICEEEIKRDPRDSRAVLRKGVLLKFNDRYQDSLQAYDEAIKLDPTIRSLAVFFKAWTYGFSARHEEAVQAYDEAIKLDPTNSYAHSGKGGMFILLGKPESALQAYDEAIKLDPTNSYGRSLAFYCKGQSLEALRRYKEAIQAYDEAIKLGLDEFSLKQIYNRKGQSLLYAHRYKEAKSVFQKALELDPNDVSSKFYLQEIERKSKKLSLPRFFPKN